MTVDIEINWDDSKADLYINAAMLGLAKCAEAILGEAKNECPVDTGTLMRSITVTEGGNVPNSHSVYETAKAGQETTYSEPVGNELSVYISANTPYSRRQHETHKSRSKYLERPFLKYKSRAKDFVERELKKI